HGGRFNYVYGPKRTRTPRHVYKGGNADWFDDVDAYGFSVIEVSNTSVIDLDHEDNSDDFGSGNADLGTHEIDGLTSGNTGLGTHESDGLESGNAGLGTHESKGIENDNVEYDNNEESDDSEESEDSDFECDIKDRVDDVHGDMEMFRKNDDPKCDLEDFDSDIDPNDDKAKRKKALRKLNMVTKISVENRRELYLTKNDKETVRAACKGLVPVFSNTRLSGDSGSNVDGPTNGPSGS
ncbi:hypothetical protein Tco_1275742, partial [Tanacetum coccineum]